jgi:regulator of replication initiation timing
MLKQKIANKNTELQRLRADVPTLVRAVHQLTLENQQLCEALTSPDSTVIPFLCRLAGGGTPPQ